MRLGVHLRHWDRTPHDVAAMAKLAEDVGLESVITYEGTEEVHTLVIGEALTGLRAFT